MNAIEIINYWYSDRIKKHWFSSTPELDKEIREKYEKIWLMALAGEFDEWQSSPEGCLALIIVLDQFPLNMFRGEAKSFHSEKRSIEVAATAIHNGFEKKLPPERLSFLFMPLMHSEEIEDQVLSVKLFKAYHLTDNIRFAEHHKGLVEKFGRFPHRNKILGRKSTLAELEYLNSKQAFKG